MRRALPKRKKPVDPRHKLVISPHLVHKPSKRDVVIGMITPVAGKPNCFRAPIVPPHKEHFLSWPLSLGHIEGMLMIEAGQQVAKAARKTFYNDQRRGYFFTGIKDLKFKKLLPSGTPAFAEVEFKGERAISSPVISRMFKTDQVKSAHYVVVETRIVDAQGTVYAEGSGNAVIYDLPKKFRVS